MGRTPPQAEVSIQPSKVYDEDDDGGVGYDHYEDCKDYNGYDHYQQGCISCGILVSRIRAHGASSEHMENMEMFSCSPT